MLPTEKSGRGKDSQSWELLDFSRSTKFTDTSKLCRSQPLRSNLGQKDHSFTTTPNSDLRDSRPTPIMSILGYTVGWAALWRALSEGQPRWPETIATRTAGKRSRGSEIEIIRPRRELEEHRQGAAPPRSSICSKSQPNQTNQLLLRRSVSGSLQNWQNTRADH